MTAQWSLVIKKRDNTAVHTFTSDDAAADGPIVAFEGQDTCNDIGVAHLTVPAEHAVNDHLTEDNLAHLYVRGAYVTSYIVKVPDVGIIDVAGEAREMAVYTLAHLLAVTEEGIVEPPGGMDSQPAAPDRIFDSSDPARDNSDFTTPDELGTVTAIQLTYPVTPYGLGMEYPGTTQLIGPAGYGVGVDAPDGRYYFFIDHDFAGGFYRVNGVGDNGAELRIDGKTIQPFTIGFGRAFQVPKMKITAGVHRVWAVVENNAGPATLAVEFVNVDAADNPVALELATSNAWSINEVPATPPGFTVGKILLTVIAEEQAYGAMTDVIFSFDAAVDSGGNAWGDTYDISTKSLTGLEQFWVKELTASLIDIDAHWDGTHIVIDAWKKNLGRSSSGLTLTEGVNLGAFMLPGEPHVMSQAAVTWNDGGVLAYHTVSQSPPAGRPVRRRPLSLGAARTIEQVVRDATSQINLFNRKRAKPTLTHLANETTADADLPPTWWKWSTIDVSLTSRWLSSGTLTLVAVTFRLTSNGLLEFTPEAGDLIVPPPARAGVTLRKMAGSALGGRSRIASPVNPIP